MVNKGLCSTCTSDASCVFPRKFPVVLCEEFDDYKQPTVGIKKEKLKKVKSNQELTEEE